MSNHTVLEVTTRVESEWERGCCLVGEQGGCHKKSLSVQLVGDQCSPASSLV